MESSGLAKSIVRPLRINQVVKISAVHTFATVSIRSNFFAPMFCPENVMAAL